MRGLGDVVSGLTVGVGNMNLAKWGVFLMGEWFGIDICCRLANHFEIIWYLHFDMMHQFIVCKSFCRCQRVMVFAVMIRF